MKGNLNPLKPVSSLIRDGRGDLYSLVAQAELLHRATHALRAHLAAPLAQHCSVGNIREGAAVVLVDSSAWAAKLRFQVAGVLDLFAKWPEFGTIRAIRVKVNPLSVTPAPVRRERLHISPQTAALMRSTAQSTDDPELKRVLQSLASRTK